MIDRPGSPAAPIGRPGPQPRSPQRRVAVRDTVLAVRDHPGRDGAGAPFVWAHGLGSSMAQEDAAGVFDWSSAVGGRRYVRFDARGHGRSDASSRADAYRWPVLARDLLGLLHALGIERAVLGGVSLGAAVGLHVALRAPDRVAGLVLAVPPAAWGARFEVAAHHRDAATIVEWQGMRRLVAASHERLDRSAGPRWVADVWRRLYDSWIPDRGLWLPPIFRGAAASDLPPPHRLHTVAVPTLVLGWEGDPHHPLATALTLGRLIPGARVGIAWGPADVERWPRRVGDLLAEADRRAPSRRGW